MCEVAERLENKGCSEERTEIISAMLAENIPLAQIAKICKCSIEDIEKIAEK